jgi:hypothetical protein
MQPAMLPGEIDLFKSVMRCATRYVEFGAGGSTVLAQSMGCAAIVTIDSSLAWLEKVKRACAPVGKTEIKTIHVDIGAVKELGYPKDDSNKDRWDIYHSAPWADPDLALADTYLIDGRFRVACVIQTALHCSNRAIVMVHDFANRPYYHCVFEIMREIARTDNLSVFQVRSDFERARAEGLLAQHARDPR